MHDTAPTILIIDNDEGLVEALRTRFTALGYTAVTATSGAQGLSTFREQPVDVVISDLNMPAGDGVALTESLRQVSDVPIVIVTGFRDEFRRRLRKVRNLTIVEKPIGWSDLLDLVEAELVISGASLPTA